MTLELEFNDKYHLWAAFIHRRTDRVFVATQAPQIIGGEVAVQLMLPDLPLKLTLMGMVIGLRPASEKFPAGAFVRFGDSEIDKCRAFLGLSKFVDRPELGRRTARADCELPLRLTDPSLPGTFIARNISETGALVSCGLALRLGQQIKAELVLDNQERLQLTAEVIWSKHDAQLIGFSWVGMEGPERASLAAAVQRLLGVSERWVRTRNVVVVEDDPTLLSLMAKSLSQRGYGVHRLVRGEDAIPTIRRVKPMLIVLDVLMPGIDGKDICKRLRGDSELANIPVILVSGLSREDLHTVAADCGATDYLLKPFAVSELVRLVEKCDGGPA